MKYIKLLIVLFLIWDFYYTVRQAKYMTPLDGDIAGIIMPSPGYSYVLDDPFAFSATIEKKSYPATNRSVVHYMMRSFLRNVPLLLQNWLEPVSSVYYSQALLRAIIKFMMIIGLSIVISGSFSFRSFSFLSAALLITPLFQIGGIGAFFETTFSSITYTSFYSFPMALLIGYLSVFIVQILHNVKVNYKWYHHLILILLAILVAFSGPLVPPLLVLVSPLIVLFLYFKRKDNNITIDILHLIFGFILVLYSVYAGSFNSENNWAFLPIADRYKLLPQGFLKLFCVDSIYIILIVIIIFNLILSTKVKSALRKHLYSSVLILICASVIYILLIPLGGYREYRPLILRSDIALPVTLILIFIYGYSSSILFLRLNKFYYRKLYLIVNLGFILWLTYQDKLDKSVTECQLKTLETIMESSSDTVILNDWCSLLTWQRTQEVSHLNSSLLQKWGILNSEKLYRHNDSYFKEKEK